MDLDLERLLAATQAGQWSVDDLAWDEPVAGGACLPDALRREAGLMLLFTAGLEQQAARIFGLAACFTDEPRAQAIYALFRADEERHAATEVRLAARLGVGWNDVPAATRWTFRELAAYFEAPAEDLRGLHEISSAVILLFELALDSILVRSLATVVEDPVLAEAFRRIDRDEARHLAMDYWLLDQKGERYAAGEAERLGGLRHRWGMLRALATLCVGFGAMALRIRVLRAHLMEPSRLGRYLARVRAVPEKAPRALDVPGYRAGLYGQERLLELVFRLGGRRFDAAEYAA